MKNVFYCLLVSLFFINCDKKEPVNTITTVQLQELLQNKSIQLLDVRTSEEIEKGYIETAKIVDYFDEDFLEKSTQLLDKNKPVYIYCRTGNRSEKSARILQEKGFEVFNVAGGYNKFKKQNN